MQLCINTYSSFYKMKRNSKLHFLHIYTIFSSYLYKKFCFYKKKIVHISAENTIPPKTGDSNQQIENNAK